MKPSLPLQPLLLALLLFALPSFSQSKTGKVDYQKGDKMAATVDLPYNADVVQEAIKDILSKKCTKSDRSKGFDVYRQTKLHDNDPELHDVHCRVESKGKKDNESVVYILIGRPGENMSVRTSDDHYKHDEAKKLLNQILPGIEAWKLESEIRDQEDLVKKEEKKLSTLVDDQKDLEKRIKSLQDKLEENKLDQKKLADEANRQRTALDNLKTRRKMG
jgi:hypothetical protein